MTLTRPWAIDAGFPNAADQRKQLASIYPREGLFPDSITMGAGVAFAGTGWGISARAFNASIKRGGAPYSQAYGSALVGNDGTVTNAWTIAAAPASGSRIDLLCIRARDTTQGDSATGTPTDGPGGAARTGFPEFVVVAGTAATTPARPALPAGYEEVAQITTPSGAASTAGSTIVQTHAFAHVVGAPIVVRNYTELDALTGILALDAAYVMDKDVLLVRRGGAWVPTVPPPLTKARDMSADNIWIDRTSATDFQVAADKTALDGTFEKYGASTVLRATVHGYGELVSGTSQTINVFLNIGGTAYAVAKAPHQTATSRLSFSGVVEIGGVPRGTLAVKPQISTSAANYRIYSGWRFSYTLEEV